MQTVESIAVTSIYNDFYDLPNADWKSATTAGWKRYQAVRSCVVLSLLPMPLTIIPRTHLRPYPPSREKKFQVFV
jgi:hypothetical protein